MKTISVLIAAYKATDFIEEGVHSVLDQKLPEGFELELLVGVDGCMETWEKLKRIKRPGLRKLLMRENVGTYVTFNTLLGHARGEFLARFDADDVMWPGYLEKQLAIFLEHEQVMVSRTWSRYIDEAGQPMKMRLGDKTYTREDGIRERPAHGAVFFRRQILSEIGGFKAWRTSADSEFLRRVKFLGYEMGVVEEPLFDRRVHPNSLTRSKATGMGSPFRNKYRDIMLKEAEERSSRADCWVEPETAEVALIEG